MESEPVGQVPIAPWPSQPAAQAKGQWTGIANLLGVIGNSVQTVQEYTAGFFGLPSPNSPPPAKEDLKASEIAPGPAWLPTLVLGKTSPPPSMRSVAPEQPVAPDFSPLEPSSDSRYREAWAEAGQLIEKKKLEALRKECFNLSLKEKHRLFQEKCKIGDLVIFRFIREEKEKDPSLLSTESIQAALEAVAEAGGGIRQDLAAVIFLEKLTPEELSNFKVKEESLMDYALAWRMPAVVDFLNERGIFFSFSPKTKEELTTKVLKNLGVHLKKVLLQLSGKSESLNKLQGLLENPDFVYVLHDTSLLDSLALDAKSYVELNETSSLKKQEGIQVVNPLEASLITSFCMDPLWWEKLTGLPSSAFKNPHGQGI